MLRGPRRFHVQVHRAFDMRNNNPWLPWRETLPAKPLEARGGALAIIPTAGRAPRRLQRCLQALEMAAGDCPLHTVVVLCPATPATRKKIRAICRDHAEVVDLEGPFNYCRSINVGLAHRGQGDVFALFLNDDAFFRSAGDLDRMRTAIGDQRWACIGPWIPEFHPVTLGAKRQLGAVRTNEPVVGTCALWNLKWLDRVGHLDEAYGLGWGMDDADLCLRALRLGARYGRLDSVEVGHLGHATFGAAHTAYDGPAHQRNMEHFQTKFGTEVHSWGRSNHWWPLPGVQVSIAARNAEQWFQRCLDSVERALAGFRWILVIGDDASRDKTFDIARYHGMRLSKADHCIVERFADKAVNVDQAKNRVLRLGLPFREQYSAMCLMDADDDMAPARVRHLLWRARDGKHAAVMGDHERHTINRPYEHLSRHSAVNHDQLEGFGPWATIFHSSLVPEDGRLFRESRKQISYGDNDLWLRWRLQGIRIKPFPGEIVHYYHCHPGTVSRPRSAKAAQQERERWNRRKGQLLAQSRKNRNGKK